MMFASSTLFRLTRYEELCGYLARRLSSTLSIFTGRRLTSRRRAPFMTLSHGSSSSRVSPIDCSSSTSVSDFLMGWRDSGIGRSSTVCSRFESCRLRDCVRDGDEIVVWYQRPLRAIFPRAEEGRYRLTLGAAGLQKSSLRPDFVLVHEPGGQVLLVEVKFTAAEHDSVDRVGIKDIFTYFHDHETLLEGKPRPRALVVGWNSVARPVPSDVLIASQFSLGEAVDVVLNSWGNY